MTAGLGCRGVQRLSSLAVRHRGAARAGVAVQKWVQPTHSRPIAIKILPIELGDNDISRRRFHTSRVSRGEVVKFHLSDIGEGIKEVTVKEWFVNVGDTIAEFDNLCEVQSDKASVTITSRYDGTIKKIYFAVDDVAQTGDALVDIELAGGSSDATTASQVETTPVAAINVGEEDNEENAQRRRKKALATPAVRRLATEHGLDVTEVSGTGKDGRVLKEDILAHIDRIKGVASPPKPAPPPVMAPPPPAAAIASSATPPPPPPPPIIRRAPVAAGQDKTEPIKGITKAMMKTMSEALEIPHFGYCDEIDVSRMVALRNELKSVAAERGIKLSYMPFIVKACSMALTQYPILNSQLDVKKETLTYKADHNIGLAMDTAQGLLVPNIKRVQDLSVFEIASELNRMHALGLAGKLGGAELNGGTFALSNIGSIGGTYAKPVILPPQVAIGALGKVQTLPRFDEAGNVVKAQLINVSWSADHRVLDGATVARFSNLMKDYIENPSKMVLDLR